MCLSSPSIPPPPPPPQAVKQPDSMAVSAGMKRNRNTSAMGGGSLLSGPMGVMPAMTGKTSLLGG